MSSFSPGASAYPMTWRQLSAEQKTGFYQKAKEGQLRLLKQALELYRAKFLIPFASHFALWHPLHRDFDKRVLKNTMEDVQSFFQDSDYTVVDLLPGETWKSKSGRFYRAYPDRVRQNLYSSTYKENRLDRMYDEDIFAQFFPVEYTVIKEEVSNYLMRLNDVPELLFSEDIWVELNITAGYRQDCLFSLRFNIEAGQLRIVTEDDASEDDVPDIQLRMWIPQQVLGHLIRDNLSWDEAHIGYWCEFERQPDQYHAGFWRALQAPYYKKSIQPYHSSELVPIHENMSIEQMLESVPQAERILRRYGLYCFSCGKGFQETIRQGALTHGLMDKDISRLVQELNQVIQ
jgi:CMP-N-acetylneuraminate monooxygenase